MAHYGKLAVAALTALMLLSTGAISAQAADTAAETATVNTDTMEMTQTGWTGLNGKLYYYYEDGTRAVGETNIDGVDYLFGYSGALKTDWQTVGGKRFYYDPATGAPQFGWVEYFGARY